MAKDTKNEQRAEAETTAVRGGLEMAIRQRTRMLIDAIFGLLRTGQVKLRKMDGWQEMESMKRAA